VPRDMFGDIVHPSVKVGSRKWYTVPLSITVHCVLIGAIMIIPLMASDILPTPTVIMAFAAASPPPAPPPPPPPAPKTGQPPPPQVEVHPQAAPIEAPKEIAPETEVDAVTRNAIATVEANTLDGLAGSMFDGRDVAPPPPPPPLPPAPVRVGGQVQRPTKIKDVNPLYPPIAQTARVQGTVIIEATIGVDGNVTDTRVLRSVPLLDQAALDAVKQWQFTPTTLNRQPVPVIMTVTVTFTLR
jgi:protein TonB